MLGVTFSFRTGGHTISDVSPVLKARIGLSSYRETARWGAWHEPADLLPAGYADAIYRAGGLPLLLPPGSSDPEVDAVDLVASIDGLVLTGGPDVAPELYGAVRLDTTDEPRSGRDAWEIALVHAAVAVGCPILAVCRGLQILNVALGGTIIQHLPDTVGHDEHRVEVGTFSRHRVRFEPGSRLAGLYDADHADVPTHHHQAVDVLAPSLEAVAWTADGTVEAVTCPGAVWISGVQWHPEVEGGPALFASFVTAAGAGRASNKGQRGHR